VTGAEICKPVAIPHTVNAETTKSPPNRLRQRKRLLRSVVRTTAMRCINSLSPPSPPGRDSSSRIIDFATRHPGDCCRQMLTLAAVTVEGFGQSRVGSRELGRLFQVLMPTVEILLPKRRRPRLRYQPLQRKYRQPNPKPRRSSKPNSSTSCSHRLRSILMRCSHRF
jgi:hypothetical protein